MTLPNFLVIGPPRTGTPGLFRRLLEHPEVYLRDVKQFHCSERDHHRGTARHESAFAGAMGGALRSAGPFRVCHRPHSVADGDSAVGTERAEAFVRFAEDWSALEGLAAEIRANAEASRP